MQRIITFMVLCAGVAHPAISRAQVVDATCTSTPIWAQDSGLDRAGLLELAVLLEKYEDLGFTMRSLPFGRTAVWKGLEQFAVEILTIERSPESTLARKKIAHDAGLWVKQRFRHHTPPDEGFQSAIFTLHIRRKDISRQVTSCRDLKEESIRLEIREFYAGIERSKVLAHVVAAKRLMDRGNACRALDVLHAHEEVLPQSGLELLVASMASCGRCAEIGRVMRLYEEKSSAAFHPLAVLESASVCARKINDRRLELHLAGLRVLSSSVLQPRDILDHARACDALARELDDPLLLKKARSFYDRFLAALIGDQFLRTEMADDEKDVRTRMAGMDSEAPVEPAARTMTRPQLLACYKKHGLSRSKLIRDGDRLTLTTELPPKGTLCPPSAP